MSILPPELDYYAKINAALFPLQPGKKVPFPGFKWQDEASHDPARWQAWASEFPGCNWAMYAAKSGLIVVDIDVKIGADAAWAEWCKVCAGWGMSEPMKPNVKTPSGGWHIYTKIPAGVDWRSLSQRGLVKGVIDIRANGYVLVPPSKIEGESYVAC